MKSNIKVFDPYESVMSMEEFVLDSLSHTKSLFVSEMHQDFRKYRRDHKRKEPKYASFRVIISNCKQAGYIESTTPNRTGFEPSAYKITQKGLQRLRNLQNVKILED